MVQVGQVLNNPVTGEQLTILRAGREEDGGSLVFDCRVAPGGVPLPVHIHDTQEERFEIISGSIGVLLGDQKLILQAGERAILPAKIKHQWWNAGEDEAYFRVEVVPPRNLAMMLEAVCGLAQAGKLSKKAMPRNPFHLVNLGLLSESYMPGVPIFVQKIGLSVGSVVGRALGFDPYFNKYRLMATQASGGFVKEAVA
ncbi:MAG: cupin domain-containing protein [Chloroflexota bacterium]